MSIDTAPSIPLPPVQIGDLVTSPVAGSKSVIRVMTADVIEASQVSIAEYTADGNAATVTIDGALYALGAAGATTAEIVAAANLIPAFKAIAVASNPSGDNFQIAFRDNAAHTVTGSVNFAAFTDSTDAAADPVIRPGRAVFWADNPDPLGYALVTEATADETFAGVALRRDLPSDTEAVAQGGTAGAMLSGRPFAIAAKDVMVKVDNRDATNDGGLVYVITDPADPDRGRFATSDGSTTDTPGTPGTLELTFTAGLAGEAVGGSIDGGPDVLLPGGSSTTAATDAAWIFPLFVAVYGGDYSFEIASNVITATALVNGTTPAFVDASAGDAAIADVVVAGDPDTAGDPATAQLVPGAFYRYAADADAGAIVELP